MKSQLTPKQSQRLIALGVDPSKASDFEEVDVTDLTDPNAFIETEYHRVFNLSDILSSLPKEVRNEELEVKLVIEGLDDHWRASYVFIGSFDVRQYYDAPELIDALFELLCWVLQSHPDKIKRL